jgi:hypothetical protein
MPQTIALILAAVMVTALLVGYFVGLYFSGQLIRRLRLNHNELWMNLGSPDLLEVAMLNRFSPLSRGEGRPTYLGWMQDSGYLEIGDDDIAALGARLSFIKGSFLVVGGAAAVLLLVGSR